MRQRWMARERQSTDADLVDMFEVGPPDPSEVEALGKRYGVFSEPTWVSELIEKHHLNSPFG